MDDDRPLFSTFKPLGEDNTASTKPGHDTTWDQPQGAEQPLGHNDTGGRVGQGVAKGPLPPVPPSSHTTGTVSSWAAIEAPRGAQSILGGHPHPSPRPLSPSLQALPGSWLSPPGWSLPEGDLQPELVALRAQTRLWFEQTQARRLGAKGELPAWFHGFISRRETEQLLQDRPPGCFLIRFSESTVGFVLSYRGRDRCRHFVLDQLPDGRYVILGEQSAHAALADLLRHYATAPLAPYHEVLTVPCRREGESQGGSQTPAGSSAVHPPSSKAPAKPLVYSTVAKGVPAARQVAAAPLLPAEPSAEGGSSREAPNVPPAAASQGQLLGGSSGVTQPRRRWSSPQRSLRSGARSRPPRTTPATPARRCQVPAAHVLPHLCRAPRGHRPQAPPPARGCKSPSPSTPWAGGPAPAPATRRTSTPRWRWPSRICPLRFPGDPEVASPRCPPNPALTAGSSAARPAKLPRGGRSRQLPAPLGRAPRTLGSSSPMPVAAAGRALQNNPRLQRGRKTPKTFTSRFLDTISKPGGRAGLRQEPAPGQKGILRLLQRRRQLWDAGGEVQGTDRQCRGRSALHWDSHAFPKPCEAVKRWETD
ncbi:SH2 domain-containing protein 2A isoform X2 [Falco naumanni]|uniref:SH2 domain-containing protein 2A isoform X2 n=1 Tax=Falco naumanni TaxID=148594 RepID=UPI001ADE39A4|nr:SH2 domain-containing protein 2A isoform X2 [Falco naumanni]